MPPLHQGTFLHDENAEQTVLEASTDPTFPQVSFGVTSHLRSPPTSPDHTPTTTSSLSPVKVSQSTAKSRKRLRCNWKGCIFKALSLEDMIEHMLHHQRCPNEGCGSKFKDEKEKRRHVWNNHRKWATQNKYPLIGGKCDICGKTYVREDYVSRHKKQKHYFGAK